MKKVLCTALLATSMLWPQAEAYHVIKPHRGHIPMEQVTQPAPATATQPTLVSSTATAYTDRSLLSKDAPASVLNTPAPKVQNVAPVQNSYKMRSGDQLQIVVYGHDDLSTRPGVSYTPYVVRPDGNLAIPLIGDVYCAGRSVPEVTAEISNRLAEYIIDPQVTINVTKLGTTRVYVLGQVKRQGLYELEKSHRLLDAVAKAEGFTDKAAKRCVYVVREGQPDFVTKVDMLDLLKRGSLEKNIELNEGDAVYISSNHKVSLQTILAGVYSISAAWENADDIRK